MSKAPNAPNAPTFSISTPDLFIFNQLAAAHHIFNIAINWPDDDLDFDEMTVGDYLPTLVDAFFATAAICWREAGDDLTGADVFRENTLLMASKFKFISDQFFAVAGGNLDEVLDEQYELLMKKGIPLENLPGGIKRGVNVKPTSEAPQS